MRQAVGDHDPSLLRRALARSRPGDVHDVVVLEAARIARVHHFHGYSPCIFTQNPAATPRRIFGPSQAEEQRDTKHGPCEQKCGEGTGT